MLDSGIGETKVNTHNYRRISHRVLHRGNQNRKKFKYRTKAEIMKLLDVYKVVLL